MCELMQKELNALDKGILVEHIWDKEEKIQEVHLDKNR